MPAALRRHAVARLHRELDDQLAGREGLPAAVTISLPLDLALAACEGLKELRKLPAPEPPTPDLPDPADTGCVTRADGECVTPEPCMHDPLAAKGRLRADDSIVIGHPKPGDEVLGLRLQLRATEAAAEVTRHSWEAAMKRAGEAEAELQRVCLECGAEGALWSYASQHVRSMRSAAENRIHESDGLAARYLARADEGSVRIGRLRRTLCEIIDMRLEGGLHVGDVPMLALIERMKERATRAIADDNQRVGVTTTEGGIV